MQKDLANAKNVRELANWYVKHVMVQAIANLVAEAAGKHVPIVMAAEIVLDVMVQEK